MRQPADRLTGSSGSTLGDALRCQNPAGAGVYDKLSHAWLNCMHKVAWPSPGSRANRLNHSHGHDGSNVADIAQGRCQPASQLPPTPPRPPHRLLRPPVAAQ